ncbi:Rieske 2Fe-2S domain-containing protein [Rhizorhabdus histidinilytica]
MNAPAKDASAPFVAPGLEDAPLNQWWVAASREEVGRAPLSRQILGRSIVLYRTEAGEVAALPDRCPHRLMPLSQGWLIGDRLRCAYHGFDRPRWPLRAHPVAGRRARNDADQALSGGRAWPVGVALAGRSRAGRPCAAAARLCAARL